MPLDIQHFDPMDTDLGDTHWSVMTELRQCPIGRSELYGGLWLMANYADVYGATRDWQTLSSAQGSTAVPIKGARATPLPITSDPPVQREIRKLIDPHFGPRKVAVFEPSVRRVAIELIEAFRGRGDCDFVAEYSSLISSIVFFEFAFGVKPDETGRIMAWVTRLLADPTGSASERSALLEWTQTLIDTRRAGPPHGDVIDSILTGEIAGRPLTGLEQRMVLMNLVIGGAETSGHAISAAIRELAENPALQRQLSENKEMIPAAVEEFLRHDPPVPVIGRTATCPIQLQGAQVEAGDRVVLYLGAANRDPAVYAEPDEIMPDRFAGRSRPQPHLTFGTGIHRCPGAHLARLEMLVTIEEILDRLPGLSLPRSSAHAYTTGTSRGLTSLPITFELTRM